MIKRTKIKAIVLAGGTSKRMKLPRPKQMIRVKGKPLLAYTLDVFEHCQLIDAIVVVAHRKIGAECRELIKRYRYQKIEQVCLGGVTRQQSVLRGLNEIQDCSYVVIHDGVRPLVSVTMIKAVLAAAQRFGAATCAVSAIDTIIQSQAGFIGSSLTRSRLWHVQTPQAFKYDLIYQAHQKAKSANITNASDDAQLVLRLKKKVRIVRGGYSNIKVTTPEDLDLLFKKLRP